MSHENCCGVAQAVGPYLLGHAGLADKWIVCGNAVALFGIAGQGVDAQDRAEWRGWVLAVLLRIVATAAVAEADVELAVIRRALVYMRVEGQRADVVGGRELADSQHFPRCALERVGGGVGGSPLANHALLILAALVQVRGRAAIWAGAEAGVELAVAGLAALPELGMEGKAE